MRRTVLAALMALLAFGGNARADNFPSHPITLVVPFSAGGPTDAMARILADHMRTTLGQNIVIENVTGAAGSLGVGRVVRAPPDGYTVSIGHLGTHVANGAIYKLGYDLVADLEPVVLLPSNPMIIVSTNAVPAKTLKELIAWLKAKPAPATAGTAGAGSGSHIAGLYFETVTGIKLQYVPYRGTAPALTDLVAGQIDIIIDQTSNSIAQVRAGTIRAYAVTDDKRVEVGGGCAEHGRGRIERISHDAVVRALGAEEHPDGCRRQTQCCCSRRHERSGGAQEVRGPWIADAAEGQAHAGGAGRLAEGGNRKMVADDQGRQRQGRVVSRAASLKSHDGLRSFPWRRRR